MVPRHVPRYGPVYTHRCRAAFPDNASQTEKSWEQAYAASTDPGERSAFELLFEIGVVSTLERNSIISVEYIQKAVQVALSRRVP